MAVREDIRNRVRDRAGIRRSTVFTDGKLNEWINGAIRDFYDILIEANEDYYTDETTLSVSSGSSSVGLPSDFYKLRALDLVKSDHKKLYPFGIAERHLQDEDGEPSYYRLQKDQIYLAPTPDNDEDIRIIYTPTAPQYSSDGVDIDFINGYERYVEFVVVRDVRLREQQPLTDIEREIQRQEQRIRASAKPRDSGQPINLERYVQEEMDEFYRNHY